ncbi:spermidine synthase [Rhodosalinus halophilus]|uniref:Spermidine synthase n=1 Tax=Rhodosalinus halophilus TaxID=2259333 RepID=A0A365UFX0_9RHOB|nr:fused MFS/spermidine synthase [Rhodosalinus halophilus]RBI87753.1 spermidine synthase [Rhodosalinus halophilus]
MRSTPLPLLVAIQGGVSAASLVVEIVAGRMLAPYVGMSLYTWTAVIAVVLAGFSAGHWWGGRIAARPADAALRATGWALLAAAATTGGAAALLRLVADPVLALAGHPVAGITALCTAVFFLPSLFAGIPAPVLAQIAIARDAARSGPALGAMFAAGAVGAIAGTLLAGFLFISWLGSALTLAVVTAFYLAAGGLCLWLAGGRGRALGAGVAAAAVGLAALGVTRASVCDTESQYFCIRTVDIAADPDRPVNLMVLDHLAHGISARDAPRVMFTDHTAMLEALPRARMGERPFSAFFIGGGSFSVPRAWAHRGIGPLTVAEIDPAVTATAARDFWFDPESAEVLATDARRALRASPRRYDVILGDAFTDIAVPAHLVTREFFELVRARLAPGGVFAMNVVDFEHRLEALAALVATLREVFPAVEVWTAAAEPPPRARLVFVILAGEARSPFGRIVARSPAPTTYAALSEDYLDILLAAKDPVVLTDDYAPIDRLVGHDPDTRG